MAGKPLILRTQALGATDLRRLERHGTGHYRPPTGMTGQFKKGKRLTLAKKHFFKTLDLPRKRRRLHNMVVFPGNLPQIDILREIVLDQQRDLPLHAQLRLSLQRLILDRFENNDRFYSETQLISILNISQGTVRRAMADLVDAGLLERRPARGTLVRKQSDAAGLRYLAVFLPEYSSPNVSRVLTLLNAECLNRGVNLQPFYTHRGEHLVRAYEQLRFRPQEGGVALLSNTPQATAELAAALEDKGYHYVNVDTLLRQSERNFVGTSNEEGNEIGLKYLLGKGHRKIALLVNEPEESENVQERIACFERYLANCGLEIEYDIYHSEVHLWEDSAKGAVKVMDKLWNGPRRPTAIFAISDMGALSAIRWLQQNGVDVPGDVSVLGFDGIEIGGLIHPGLTSVAQPFEKIAEAIFELLKVRSSKVRQVFLTPYLLERESVASVGPAIEGASAKNSAA